MTKFFKQSCALVAFAVGALALILVSGVEHALAALVPTDRAPLMRSQAGFVQLIPCAPFSNVTAAGLASARMDSLIGYTVDRIILQLGGTALTKAMLSNIKIYANEKPIFDDSGTNCDTRMAYRGLTANAAFLSLDFSEPRARTIVGQHAGSLDTISSGVKKLQVDVTIAGATAPTLQAFAMLSAGGQKDPSYNRLISKVFTRTISPAAAGEFLFDLSYARVPGSFIKRVHLIGATVTGARLKKNGSEIWNLTDARNDFIQTEFLRVPQANQMCLDFLMDGNISEALAMENVSSLEPYVTVSGAGNVTIVTEMLDLLENN